MLVTRFPGWGIFLGKFGKCGPRRAKYVISRDCMKEPIIVKLSM